MKTKLVFVLTLVALLAAGVPGVALAAPDEAQGILVTGQVTAISGDTFDMQSRQGREVKVQTDTQTRFRVRGVQNATIDAIKIGDVVAVRGQRAGDALHAKVVAVLPPQLRDQVAGQVTAIQGATLALEDKDGQAVNVLTTAVTLFRSKDNPNATLADIKVGDLVTAVGVREGDTLTAIHVGFRTPPQRQPGPIVTGEIQTIDGGTLTIKQPYSDPVTVNTSSTTLVVLRVEGGTAVGSLADLKVGDTIMTIGLRSSDNSQLDALVIVAGKAK